LVLAVGFVFGRLLTGAWREGKELVRELQDGVKGFYALRLCREEIQGLFELHVRGFGIPSTCVAVPHSATDEAVLLSQVEGSWDDSNNNKGI